MSEKGSYKSILGVASAIDINERQYVVIYESENADKIGVEACMNHPSFMMAALAAGMISMGESIVECIDREADGITTQDFQYLSGNLAMVAHALSTLTGEAKKRYIKGILKTVAALAEHTPQEAVELMRKE